MKKVGLLFLVLINVNAGFSQQLKYELQYPLAELDSNLYAPLDSNQFNKTRPYQKAAGDTIFYEDFSDSLLSSWTITNRNFKSWMWHNSAPGGQYSLGVPALNSTSGSNGFLTMRADWHNTPLPSPPTTFDETATSAMIPISPTVSTVYLKFEQSQRYCCLNSGQLVAEVSSDSINWTTYDATNNRSPNTFSGNGEKIYLNVSAALSNQSQAFIRFRFTGASHYFWMIDDVLLFEEDSTLLTIDRFQPIFTNNPYLKPVFSIVPQHLMPPVHFSTAFTNQSGTVSQNGIINNIKVYQDSTHQGNPGIGGVYNRNFLMAGSFQPLQKDTFITTSSPYINLGAGKYRFVSDLSSSRTFAAKVQDATFQLTVSDSVFAVDLNNFLFGYGPKSYVGGGQSGDKMGQVFDMMANNGTATSISVFIANDLTNIGAQIIPQIWPLISSLPSTNIAINTNSYTITTADLGQWVHLRLPNPVNLTADSQYVVGIEQTSANQDISLGAEFMVDHNLANDGLFIYRNNASSLGWFSTSYRAGIRLNFDPNHPNNSAFSVGLSSNKASKSLKLYPNPAKGQITLELKEKNFGVLQIRDRLGRVVYQENIRRSKTEIELSKLPAGLYIVTVDGEDRTLVSKIVLQ